jgi:hypothetical protein
MWQLEAVLAGRFPVFRVHRDMGGKLESRKQLAHLPHPLVGRFSVFQLCGPPQGVLNSWPRSDTLDALQWFAGNEPWVAGGEG